MGEISAVKLFVAFILGIVAGAIIALNHGNIWHLGQLDWTSNDWNAVGALGQWAGAIATFSAVAVALKTTYDASKNRIKVEVSFGFLTGIQPEGVQMIIFSATNIGVRQVKLQSSGVVLPNNSQLIFPYDTIDKLPATLQSSDQVTYWVILENVKAALRERNLHGTIKLKVFFTDSHGIRHWGKLKIPIED